MALVTDWNNAQQPELRSLPRHAAVRVPRRCFVGAPRWQGIKIQEFGVLFTEVSSCQVMCGTGDVVVLAQPHARMHARARFCMRCGVRM